MHQPRVDPVSVLRKVDLLADLSDKELNFLSDRALRRRFRAGEMLFYEGDPCIGLYVIEAGTIKIFETSESGRELALGTVGSRQFCG